MKTAPLLILALTLKSFWGPSSVASVEIRNAPEGRMAMGGSAQATSFVMTGGSTGLGAWGGNAGQGPWGGYGGHCGPNGCGVPQTPNGCNSPTGCKPVLDNQTVAGNSTDRPEGSDPKYPNPFYVYLPAYVPVPIEMEAFAVKQRRARSLIENFIPNLTENSEGTSEKRMTRNFIESLATSVSENLRSANKDTQRSAKESVKSRVPRSIADQLNGYPDYGVQNEMSNKVVE